jgi:hypothetical protein
MERPTPLDSPALLATLIQLAASYPEISGKAPPDDLFISRVHAQFALVESTRRNRLREQEHQA